MYGNLTKQKQVIANNSYTQCKVQRQHKQAKVLSIKQNLVVQQQRKIPVKQFKIYAQDVGQQKQSQGQKSSNNGALNKPAEPEYYEVYLDKPIGIKFIEGNTGGIYVERLQNTVGNVDDQIQVGDQLMATSSSFGDEIWDAGSYQQVLYALSTRLGEVYLKFKKCYGDTTPFTGDDGLDDVQRLSRAEKRGGNYGAGTREVQTRKYEETRERDDKRRSTFEEGLKQFKAGDPRKALDRFIEVINLEPRGYIGAGMQRVTDILKYAYYNIACCHSVLGNVEDSLVALENSIECGYKDIKKIKDDVNLQNTRQSEKFSSLIEKYDDSFIDEKITGFFKNLFSFGKKQ